MAVRLRVSVLPPIIPMAPSPPHSQASLLRPWERPKGVRHALPQPPNVQYDVQLVVHFGARAQGPVIRFRVGWPLCKAPPK
jgi:hypothetical protein